MDLTIAIPTHNNFKQLVDCLYTLTFYNEYPFKIVVINNGDAVDPDGKDFEETLRNHIVYPHLKVISPGENLGWQGAINKAFLEECDTRLFAMCNDDLVFLPFSSLFLRQLCNHFRFEEIGAVGPCSNFVAGAQNLWRHGLPKLFCTTLLIGFCMVIRSDLFSKIGGLDEGMPGGDDLDLSILVRKHGYKLLVDRTCYVHHIGCQTGDRINAGWWNSLDHQEESNNHLIRKHGLRAWYDTTQAAIMPFEPLTVTSDVEGDLIREWIGDDPNGLDVGVGHNKTIPGCTGVDRAAKGEYGMAGGRKFDRCVADVCAPADNMPFEDGSQNYVICRHVLEHIIDPLPSLKEFLRVLRPGGRLIIVCPNQETAMTILMDWSHVHGYSVSSIQNLLEMLGFTITRTGLFEISKSFIVEAIKPDVCSEYERTDDNAISGIANREQQLDTALL
jgi:GT2 family glycosyltransferase